MESYFIREVLLGRIERPIRILPIEPGQQPGAFDDTLIVCVFDRAHSLIKQAIQSGARNVGVFHVGDERFELDRSFYNDVDYVVRNYFRSDAVATPPATRCMQVLWVPNGYRYGIGPLGARRVTPFPARQHTLFFSGQMNPGTEGARDRIAMIQVLKQSRVPVKAMCTDRFAAGFGLASYSAIMENSRFALAPRGWAEETIRLYDALELGAIPISLRHEFLTNPDVMGGAPIVLLDNWEQLPEWYAQSVLVSDRDRIWQARQSQLADWWSAFKNQKQTEVATLIERSFAKYPMAP